MTLPKLPNIGCHPRILSLTDQDHLCTHARLCFVCGRLVIKSFTMSCYEWAKRSLQTCTCSNWNVCNRHCNRRSQHWWIAKVYSSCMTTPGRMSREWPGIPYSDLVGRLCAILLTHLTLLHQITTSSTPWTIIFMENPSPMKQTCGKNLRTSLRPIPRVLPQGDCTARDTLAQGAGCQWSLLWGLTIGYSFCKSFSVGPLKTARTLLVTWQL